MSISSTSANKRKPSKNARHDYKQYIEADGQKIIVSCARIYAHLQSCGILNPTGSVVLRYLMIDIDAHRTPQKWKDQEGKIDYHKVHNFLSTKLPKICASIEYITRSHGGKGIHLIIGFSALPLEDSTVKMQSVCSQIQNLIIMILNEYGLGADEGARGLNRLFSTFRDENKLLHHNNILTKNIEKQRKLKDKNKKIPYLLNLLKACKKYAKKLELNGYFRLYNHKAVEHKVAKLYLYTIGMLKIKPMQNLGEDLKPKTVFAFKQCSPNNVTTLTIEQIMHITGLSRASLRELNFFSNKSILALWDFDFNFDGSVSLLVKNVSTLAKRITRAKQVLHGYQAIPNRINPDLIDPCLVNDGERNFAICSWVLAYKWAGFNKEDTLDMVLQLVKSIPGNEFSRSCKESQVTSVVNSIFRYKEELEGIKKEPLPDFMYQLTSGKKCIKTGLEPIGRKPEAGLGTDFKAYIENKRNSESKNVIDLSERVKNVENGILTNFCEEQRLKLNDKMKCEILCHIRKDGFVYHQGKYYSVGRDNINKTVRMVDYDGYLYFYANNILIEEHVKVLKRFKKYSIKEHHKLNWDEIKKLNSAFLYKANEIGPDCEHLISAYLSNSEGFSDNQYICGIISLNEKISSIILNEACRIALESGHFSARFIKSVALRLSENLQL
ncbi:hypothetical protein [Fluviispira sanaruensis]|uniref:Uncharacterized protein n=1 Tax=Fluviispira sanaruensis TaxID=2493639 RepID=A0A4P2VMQ5_FLUSA|nr:hypothetical protein [Fluviispira sanaruensis]BBH54696.1 hypothetical protein JCM31447_31700 [Fluviispira sanaruensis]